MSIDYRVFIIITVSLLLMFVGSFLCAMGIYVNTRRLVRLKEMELKARYGGRPEFHDL